MYNIPRTAVPVYVKGFAYIQVMVNMGAIS